jgi:hypothetical protein
MSDEATVNRLVKEVTKEVGEAVALEIGEEPNGRRVRKLIQQVMQGNRQSLAALLADPRFQKIVERWLKECLAEIPDAALRFEVAMALESA